MISKRILPESFGFDVPSVDIVDCGRNGLDKTAMLKRASEDAFADVIAELKPEKGHTYLHVITTGAMEKYGANRNCDAFNESECDYTVPFPEKGGKSVMHLDGGLKKYHDSSYMDKKAGVYQEHHSNEKPSGKIVAARYNEPMHRGELIISVDNEKWANRLQKKARGENIYLSMGCAVPRDVCTVCGRSAKTMSEHCDHFKKMKNTVMDNGTQVAVINDTPKFYDISGVDTPADRIAFVLRKVGSENGQVKEASAEALHTLGARTPMLLTKSARILSKLAEMEKRIDAFVEGDDNAELEDDDDVKREFIAKVDSYPADEVISMCNGKGLLLSPDMLFKLLGKECDDDEDRENLEDCDDGCCGDCSAMMRELADDEDNCNAELLDGSFDQRFPADVHLADIVDSFMQEFGVTEPALSGKSIRIIITGSTPHRQHKKASASYQRQEALRRTYARYMISFAERNDDATCFNALRKIAHFGK